MSIFVNLNFRNSAPQTSYINNLLDLFSFRPQIDNSAFE